jgi:glycosyltransferase involved in cell wall biosynthesis
MDVLFIASGGLDTASTRYRVLNMFPYLEEYGVSCEFAEIPSSGDFTSKISFAFNILKQAIQHDVVFIQKTLFPPWFLKLINKLVDGIIFDYDDAVYTSPPKKNGGRPVLLNDNLANVNVVIAGSPILSTYAKTHASKVYCLPTSIPKEEYKKWTPRQRKNTSRLGWIGNPENLIYIDMVAAVLERILDNYPELELWVITSGNLPVEPLRSRKDVIYKQWSREQELELLSSVDIGIRPLSDDEWTRAKGGFTSVVQCMALQLPVIVSPVGMLTDMIENGETGLFAIKNEQWMKSISYLVDNTELRQEMGQKACKSLSEQRFWTEQRAMDLYEILETEF